MKNKLFLLLVIIAVVGIAAVLNYGKVWAQADVEIPEPFNPTKSEIWVEFSNYLDRQAVPGGGAINGLDPLQVLLTTPFDPIGPPNPKDDDALDFGGTGEVDALANIRDLLFGRLIANKADLLVSFLGDPNYNNPPTNIPKVAVYIEYAAGNNPLWTQVSLNNPNTPPPQLEDLDGLQLWGFEGYANMYSLQGDFTSGTSIFYWNGAAPAAYVPQADIVAAVQAPSLDPGHFTGSASQVDLDGLMVLDNGDHAWNSGDTIIFSIRAAANWDGGEIVVLPWDGKPNSAFYLNHGGHLWNTAFPVASTFHLDPPTEEVDAIEAYPPMTYGTPTLTQWGLIILVALIIASGVFIALRRRKAAVPA
jgi:hypothetical protein